MNESEQKELARAYVALSNAHRLELILPMFSEDAVYVSATVGRFEGRQAIGRMMRGFFERYPEVFWRTRDYRCEAGGWVAFDFVMTANDATSQDRLERNGIERIRFGDEARIVCLQVEVAQTTRSGRHAENG